MTSASSPSDSSLAVRLLASLNDLTVKAFSCKSEKALAFFILNDTIQLLKYDRAFLFEMRKGTPTFRGVSGQTRLPKESELMKKLEMIAKDLVDPFQIQVLAANSFRSTQNLFLKLQEEGPKSAILWVPIVFEGKLLLGLWLERWSQPPWQNEEMKMAGHLARGYAAAWQKFAVQWKIPKISTLGYGLFFVALFLLSLIIPVPLRVVAPCEVVAKDPILITAPLNGVVEEMIVKPGEVVEKGEILFVYDKRIPLQELKVAQKQVDIANSQLKRMMTLGVRDPKALTETAIWQLQLEKEKIKLDLAEYHASQLEVTAPEGGVAAFDNPDEWRGKPVSIGERVMVLTRPEDTKVRIWLAESDNIPIEQEKPVKIFLNIDPARTYYAELTYISEYSALSEKDVPSFNAEAKWLTPPQNTKIGLKGSAVLYGKEVSLFYWLMRKPWNTFRWFIGI